MLNDTHICVWFPLILHQTITLEFNLNFKMKEPFESAALKRPHPDEDGSVGEATAVTEPFKAAGNVSPSSQV